MAFWSRKKEDSAAAAAAAADPAAARQQAREAVAQMRAPLDALEREKEGTGFDTLADDAEFTERIAELCRQAVAPALVAARAMVAASGRAVPQADLDLPLALRDAGVIDAKLAMDLSETFEMAQHFRGRGNLIDRRFLVIFWRERLVDLEALARSAG